MLLTKGGVTISVTHPADIRRYRSLGYKTIDELTAEQQNAEAIKAVNESKGTPSAKPKAKDGEK